MSGDVKWILGLVNLELKKYGWAEERDLRVIGKKMLCEAMSVYEVLGEVVHREVGMDPALSTEGNPIF
jgi:hypothetical protein